jgi:PAS domain-containing protein
VHRLVAKQIAKATDASGAVDMNKLVALVGGAYDEFDRDRRRTDRSMSLMIEEIDAINRNLEQLVAKRTSELRSREQDLQAQGLLLFDSSQQLVVCNQRYIEMYGLSAAVVKPGCSFREIIAHRKATGSFAGDMDDYCARILQNIRLRNSMVVETRDGRSIQIVNEPLADGGWVVTHEDITERRLAEEQIRHLAHYDALTDLPNRALFHERLKQELARIAAGQ